ncbi:hypothetical protein SEA_BRUTONGASTER_63 [Gordonia phage BrutonGaster]|uniref:Uncharacterized protein n=1 Tax=Gordonia phage BrutonGaster TaxID=2530116 RepID=A0A482JMH4_9CAUD|nr:hypothetical protein HOV26_gp119 [Gordonia phage BrutonGaster]QBP33280.1 hypothetical protein SEA_BRUTONGASTER_63 [Gordonia phage BrutonGaster]
MKLEITLGCGLTRPDSVGKSPADGIYIEVGSYHFELRRQRRHELKSDHWEGEARHWWQSERQGIYDTLFLPIGRLCVDGFRSRQSYAEYCGVPYLSVDWILDEFDSSFNDLAVASLKYHLELSVACNEHNRDRYEDLMKRLTEEEPTFTKEESDLVFAKEGGFFTPEADTPAGRSVFADYRDREKAYLERIRQARHDFVDIMPELWS